MDRVTAFVRHLTMNPYLKGSPMKKFLPTLAIATLALTACSASDDTAEGVTITVNNVSESGKIYVALQNESIFGAAKATYGMAVDSNLTAGGSVDVVLKDVAAGDYAVAVFQDTNGNGQLDLGSNGVPGEPWALSNGAGTSGAPSFSKAKMSFDGMGDRASVTLSN